MRRIYESNALHRDDEEAHAPSKKERKTKLQALRSVPSSTLSDFLIPRRFRHLPVSVDVETPDDEYETGEPIPFRVTLRNRLPVPISIPTRSPLLWRWTVDGNVEAAEVSVRDPPDEEGQLSFDRGERKEFRKRWDQLFRVSESEWEPAAAGTHTIGVAINATDAEERGLTDETTVRIVP
ncbi:hypothetical protein C464_07375 [Halorubrum coriense DSM 10284]|uniref:DUF7974 domain-containing protein n=1 Tax=Halorubrum coriense DSM 10284 TaxID=1227466 RepID=M0EPE0_9EURY|nr:hypothetical protein [Halorubrum coriense]ELZ48279.1 hypothetical protein C464_07375 [Halorubrum coriense DSM 10284]